MFYNSIISQFILFYTFYIFVDFIPTWLISWFSTFKLCTQTLLTSKFTHKVIGVSSFYIDLKVTKGL
jgi:hypothetical protein